MWEVGCVSGWVCGGMGVCMNECVGGWVCEWMVCGWMSMWVVKGVEDV